jgi:hypothetical protein
MGTTSSSETPTTSEPVLEKNEENSVKQSPPVAPSEVTTSPISSSEPHPRDHQTSKEAFARVATATESDKSSVLSSELAAAEALAEVNLSQFFEALESRCETEEEREALKGLIKHRKEEQERWELARSGNDPNEMKFPTGNYEPPQIPANSLEWWVGLPSAAPRDVNEKVFPLRHFESKGDADNATQEEVATSAETLRADINEAGAGGWVNDELSDGEVVNNKELAWKMTPAIEGMTENEVKFLNAFWERRGLAEETGNEKEFTTTVEPAGAWAPVEPLKDVIANDLTTPDQEAVIKLRQTRGKLTDEVRNRRVKLLAQHFAEREQQKLEAKKKNQRKCSPTKKSAEEAVPVPSTAFFEERLEVATEESTKAQKANRLAQEEAVIDKLAEEGSKYTSFASPSKDDKKEEGFPFTSPEAKARVDAIIARREKEREEAHPSREAPKPPTSVDPTPPPPPTTSEE